MYEQHTTLLYPSLAQHCNKFFRIKRTMLGDRGFLRRLALTGFMFV
jgi:hypothetical protein